MKLSIWKKMDTRTVLRPSVRVRDPRCMNKLAERVPRAVYRHGHFETTKFESESPCPVEATGSVLSLLSLHKTGKIRHVLATRVSQVHK